MRPWLQGIVVRTVWGTGLALWAAAATAQGSAPAQTAITFYAGARGGGEFSDASNSAISYGLSSGAAGSFSVDWNLQDGRQGQVFVSLQRSGLPAAAFGQTGGEVAVDIAYVHFGGRAFFEGSRATQGGYAVGGLGLTVFSPGLGGTNSEWRPSGNIGFGYQWPIGPQAMLRTELRGYGTLVNSSGEFFCSGGCVVSIRGGVIGQAEAMVGLSVGF